MKTATRIRHVLSAIRSAWSVGIDDKWYSPVEVPLASGVKVNERTALNCLAVSMCVRILSETIASLPWFVYRRTDDGGKMKATEHPLWHLLHYEPNRVQTSYEFRELLVGNVARTGNAYSFIEREGTSRIVGLWPLRPELVKPQLAGKWQIVYKYQPTVGEAHTFAAQDIWHVKWFSLDGLVGMSPIQMAREGIGLAVAAREMGARLFGQGGLQRGFLSHPAPLSDTAYKRLKTEFNKEEDAGLAGAHKFKILEEGMNFIPSQIPPDDAQFLQTREFQDTQIAGFYRIPAHMVNQLRNATYSNIEHQGLEFVVHTLRPWLVRIEQSAQRALFAEEERGRYFSEFLVDGLLRGDVAARASFYQTLWQIGAVTSDEIRALENMNPLPDETGKKTYVPMNFVPAGAGAVPPEAEAARDNLREYESRLLRTYKPLLSDRLLRLLKRERSDIEAALKGKLRNRTPSEIKEYLQGYYAELRRAIAAQLWPVYESLENRIVEDFDWIEKDGDASIEDCAERHVAESLGELESVIAETPADDVQEMIRLAVAEWTEARAEREAVREIASYVESKTCLRLSGRQAGATHRQVGRPKEYAFANA